MQCQVRILLFILWGLYLPAMCGDGQNKAASNKILPFKLGVENIDHWIWQHLRDQQLRVGVITNQTGKDQQGNRTIDLLVQRNIAVQHIFAPEHGLDGTIAAGQTVPDQIDAITNLTVTSLYARDAHRKVNSARLAHVDALVFDLQECGMRHYTYISTLYYVMLAAAEHDKMIIVLDRPNHLDGHIEGPLNDPKIKSFIAVAPIPLRYGMTIGELARYYNEHLLPQKARLHVVPMEQFVRNASKTEQFVPLSPYIQTQAACYGYSFLGLLGEVRPIDTGLGTDKAMQCIALPEKSSLKNAAWLELAQSLKKLGIDTKPIVYYSPRKKQKFKGLQLTLKTMHQASAFQALLVTLKYLHTRGVHLTFSKDFDKAIGTHKVRDYVKGKLSRAHLAQEINSNLEQFLDKSHSCFLYAPAPQLIKMSATH